MKRTIIVNGTERTAASAGDRSLLEVLRDDLGVIGLKFGCGEGACGAGMPLAPGGVVRAVR